MTKIAENVKGGGRGDNEGWVWGGGGSSQSSKMHWVIWSQMTSIKFSRTSGAVCNPVDVPLFVCRDMSYIFKIDKTMN